MTIGRIVRRLLTASVVAVIGIGLSALPATADVRNASVGAHQTGVHSAAPIKCTTASPTDTRHAKAERRRCALQNQRAEKTRDRRCMLAQKKADRLAKRAAGLTGQPAVRAAKRAALAQKRAKRLCALAGPAHPQPPKPATPPGQGVIPPVTPIAPGPPPVLPVEPVVPAPVAPPTTAPVAPVTGAGGATTSNSAMTSAARKSRAASLARASVARANKLRATARDSGLPFVISSRDSRIPLTLMPAVTPKATFPLGLMVLLLSGFLFVQRWIDRGDPKLATASGPDRDLPFE